MWMVDHLTGFFPRSVWDRSFTWMAKRPGSSDAFYDWQVLAGRLASSAGRIQLGVGVTDAIRRHPVVLAQAALTLSHMTHRRPILGIGSGEAENVIPYGLGFDRPVARLEEGLAIIRMCLDEPGPHDFTGTFFRLDGARLDLGPGSAGKPLVWVGAHAPRMLELTGRFGDGWLPALPMSPPAYAGALQRIRTSAAHAGRDPDSIVPALNVQFLVGRDRADVAAQLRHPAIRFLALLAPDRVWQANGASHPLGRGFAGLVDFVPGRYDRAQIQDAIAAVPPELLEHSLIAGTTGHVVERIWELVDAGLRHVVLSPVSPLVSRTALATTVSSLPGIIRRLRTGDDRSPLVR